MVRILKSTWGCQLLVCGSRTLSCTHTNGRDVALGVGVVGETEEKTRLANTGVTDKEKLRVSVSPNLGTAAVGRLPYDPGDQITSRVQTGGRALSCTK